MKLMQKTVIALILILIVTFIIGYLRQINILWFDILIMISLILSVHEMDNAFTKSGYKTIKIVLVIAVSVILPMYLWLGIIGAMMTVIISFMIGGAIITFNHKFNYKDLAVTSFILIYPMLLMIIFTDINHRVGGFFGILTVLIIAIASDTFAQWIGMAFKGRKLCPTISPNKTVAGAIGAYVGGLVGAGILFLIFEYYLLFENVSNINFSGLTSSPWKSLPIYLALALIGSTTAQVGDLFASWLKRQFSIKDFGTILPGHGGIMDRADSLLYTVPIFYLIFLMIPNLLQ